MTKFFFKGDSFYGYHIKKFNRKAWPYLVITYRNGKITNEDHFQTKKLAERWIRSRAKRLGIK